MNTGDTAWVLMSSALVLLMTAGLAFFYSGLVPVKNTINTINMSFICLGVIPIVWSVVGYSLAFAQGHGAFAPFVGSLDHLFLNGVGESVSEGSTIPDYAFMVFQMMFAILTPALISGSLVGRMKFKAYVLFIILWSIFVYSPLCHWVWGPDGWIGNMPEWLGTGGKGALDFAGGTVVHINAGFAGLTAAAILGPRITASKLPDNRPHNVPFVVLGGSMLWFGWFGFNAGSELAADGVTCLAFVTTVIATAASIFTWTILSWLKGHRVTGVGVAVATVVGLVAITPACAFVTPMRAIFVGSAASLVCYLATVYKGVLIRRIDDTLDVFICHGLAGVVGSLLTGIIAHPDTGGSSLIHGDFQQFWAQCIAVGAAIAWSCIMTGLILMLMKIFIDLRPTKEDEEVGIDILEHGEAAYGE